MKKNSMLLLVLLLSSNVFSQDYSILKTRDTIIKDSIQKVELELYKEQNYNVLRKGRMSISWGYNRASYSRSTIRFWGNGYDFKIRDATAVDKPEPSFRVYINPGLFTIPQYNFRVGYFITNNLSISFNIDHMKYVLDNSQTAVVDGTIDSTVSTRWAGNYDNKLMDITNEFVKFEHTDGLNYITAELDYNSIVHDEKNFSIDLIAGVGIGAIVPKTNAYLLNTKGADAFHWAGVGISGQIGARFYIYRNFFIDPRIKMGYMYMPNIATNGLEIDKASQSFYFFEKYLTVGYQFKIFK